MALGDDTTDDDMFRALPQEAITIKIGTASEYARYNILKQTDTLPFLLQLLNNCQSGKATTDKKKKDSDLHIIIQFLKKFIKEE